MEKNLIIPFLVLVTAFLCPMFVQAGESTNIEIASTGESMEIALIDCDQSHARYYITMYNIYNRDEVDGEEMVVCPVDWKNQQDRIKKKDVQDMDKKSRIFLINYLCKEYGPIFGLEKVEKEKCM